MTPSTTSACGGSSHDSDDDEHEDDDDHDHDKAYAPALSALRKVSLRGGERLNVAVTASDCADRPIEIQATGLPSGATLTNSFDAQLQLPKAVIIWNSPVNHGETKTIKVMLKAVATEADGSKVSSEPQALTIQVLPTATTQSSDHDRSVKSVSVASARLTDHGKKLEVSGQVYWAKDSTAAERNRVAAKEKVVISNATTDAPIGAVTLNKEGKWKKVLTTNSASAPCSIDVGFGGKTSVKAVSGAKNCHK